MIAHRLYINETTRHAHLILPPTSPLERDHYDLVFNALAVQNVAKFSPAVFERPAGALHDWEILDALDLAADRWRSGSRGALARTRGSGAKRAAGLRRVLDYALRTGPYGKGWVPGRAGLSLGALLDAPHGMVLGPLEPCLPSRLATKDRAVELAPDRAGRRRAAPRT